MQALIFVKYLLRVLIIKDETVVLPESIPVPITAIDETLFVKGDFFTLAKFFKFNCLPSLTIDPTTSHSVAGPRRILKSLQFPITPPKFKI